MTDNLTGLMWAKDANLFGSKTWADAITACENLVLGSGCGCTDCGDWRLPNVRELQSLIDCGNYSPALPSGHPFTNVQSLYWSSTSLDNAPNNAWIVRLLDGLVSSNAKVSGLFALPVRGGN